MLSNVPTYAAVASREDRDYVLAHLDELVVKEVHGSGGYGMLVGPDVDARASASDFRARILAHPGQLHRAAHARAVDVPDVRRARASRRATSTCGRTCCPATTVHLVPGGLTRVALREGSLVVNSSQGGGTKDTWVRGADCMLSRSRQRTCTGWRATSSAPRTPRACSTSRGACRCCPTGAEPDLHWAEHGSRRSTSPAPLTPFYATPHASVAPTSVLHFMALDPRQPVVDLQPASRRRARTRARCAARSPPRCGRTSTPRGSRCADRDEATIEARGVSAFFDWVKERTHLFRGVTFGTMLRDEAYDFSRLGTHIERADNTARILDMKYHMLLPRREGRGRRGRLLPVGGGAAVGVGLRGLPQGLPRRDHAAQAGRAADPARRHAALACTAA